MRRPAYASPAAARLAGLDWRSFQGSRVYDGLMRLPVLLWGAAFGTKAAIALAAYEREADPLMPDAIFAVHIAMQLAVIAFFITLAGTVLIRERPTGRARGIEPRLSALIGTLLIGVVVLFPRHELGLAAGVVSTALLLLGNAVAVHTLTHLGGSFSIMPEARGLVTTGLYRHVRHPLYLAEMVAAVGAVMQYLSVWTLLILAVQIAFQLRRMHNEEAVLMARHPDYAAYRRRTAAVLPGIY